MLSHILLIVMAIALVVCPPLAAWYEGKGPRSDDQDQEPQDVPGEAWHVPIAA